MRSSCRTLLAAGLLVLGSGCAQMPIESIDGSVRVASFGDADPYRDQRLTEEANALSAKPDIRVIRGLLPGLSLGENRTQIEIADGYESRYEILGVVEADLTESLDDAFFKDVSGTWDYQEPWRKALCYSQVPLRIATLFLWFIVPTHYPCVVEVWSAQELETVLHDEMRRGAAALGGNLVILGNHESKVVGENEREFVRVYLWKQRAFVLRVADEASVAQNATTPARPGYP